MQKPEKPSQRAKKRTILRSTLTQQIVDLIKLRILHGELEMGDRLWAADLSEELGVSIIPTKEALLILSGEGLVTNIPRRGSVIRRFNLKEMNELYDIRRLLESEAIQIILRSGLISDDYINELKSINEKLGKCRKNGEFLDRAEANDLDWKFHHTLINACGHDLIIELFSRLNMQAQIIRYASWDLEARADKTYFEHCKIIESLESGNIKSSKQAIKDHLASIVGDFNQKYKNEDSSFELNPRNEKSLPSGRRNK